MVDCLVANSTNIVTQIYKLIHYNKMHISNCLLYTSVITNVFPGQDSLVRVVEVRTALGLSLIHI